MQISPNLHFQVIISYKLTSDDLWPWFVIFWPHEHMKVPILYQVWFQSDFNFSNETIFTFSAYLTTWSQRTFDLDIWPLTAWTYEGSHIISINQVWFQWDLNFSNDTPFTFSAYLTTWPQMTFDLDMWPLTSSTNEGSHVASMTQFWLKSIKACGSYSQMLTLFHDRQQQTKVDMSEWSLCVFPAKSGDTKTMALLVSLIILQINTFDQII